ncbi:hypothetical protein B296_00051413 [Ensete ventricosum]|uniref:Uncharacterized protein n=1 Tax=Ensete ventricosum TaxID=4639 RepID=A0A426YGT0_ENSVE|nr:hypothetical protein B296_00051413 [Ensete ventricosum]
MAIAHCLLLLYKEGTASSFSLSNDSKSTTAVLLSLPFRSIGHHLPLLLCWQRHLGCQPLASAMTSLLVIATSVNLAATAALVSSSSAEISDATSRSVTASPLPPAAIVHLLRRSMRHCYYPLLQSLPTMPSVIAIKQLRRCPLLQPSPLNHRSTLPSKPQPPVDSFPTPSVADDGFYICSPPSSPSYDRRLQPAVTHAAITLCFLFLAGPNCWSNPAAPLLNQFSAHLLPVAPSHSCLNRNKSPHRPQLLPSPSTSSASCCPCLSLLPSSSTITAAAKALVGHCRCRQPASTDLITSLFFRKRGVTPALCRRRRLCAFSSHLQPSKQSNIALYY